MQGCERCKELAQGSFIKINTTTIVTRYPDEFAFFEGKPYHPTLPARSVIIGNSLLQSGQQLICDLIMGAVTNSHMASASCRIGVGSVDTGVASTDSGILGSASAWRSMETGYPSRTSETMWFRAIFGSTEGNISWQEFVLENGAAGGVPLNRVVSDQGIKTAGQVWTVDVKLEID